ncbi:MAG TPA: hypothetical protein VFS26_06865 [Solirubrobacterales bacterium]|nr:hypothetical protein [Solirubrobacterales bacterium]
MGRRAVPTVEGLVGAVKLIGNRLHGSPTHAAVDSGDPAHIFTRDDVLERLKEQTPSHYAGIYNVMKGVTLAAAGLALVSVLVEHLPFARGMLLLVAFLAVIISYNGATVGQTVVHLHPSMLDVILPMALTIAELVVVTLPGFDHSTQAVPSAWLLALGIWEVMAGTVVFSILARLEPLLYQDEIWPTVSRYRTRLKFDWKCATGGGAGAIVYWIASRVAFPAWSGWDYLDYVFLAAVLGFFVGALAHHGETRRELVTTLLRTPEPPTVEIASR